MEKQQQHVQMGYDPNDRLLIINADDYGMCHSMNAAAEELLLAGAISSATLMVPCAWAKEGAAFAKKYPQVDIGVHLTFTSEWDHYKWGPVTRLTDVNSLITDEGFFPEDCLSFELQAEPEQVKIEIQKQIEQAIAWGVDPTHLDVHMGSLYGLATGRDYLEVVLEACEHYKLPLRLPRGLTALEELPPELQQMAAARIALADHKGIMIIDDLLTHPFHYTPGETFDEMKQGMIQMLKGLRAGITEIFIHPGYATEELKAIQPDAPKRDMEARLFLDDEIRNTIKSENIRMITWRDLRDHQRRMNV
ncbi:polysaccharide deacetylase family protein [Paenibacillus albiflavus]|nr:polysaccharide deacetylase family protein [Paenibacillus albiflavus]